MEIENEIDENVLLNLKNEIIGSFSCSPLNNNEIILNNNEINELLKLKRPVERTSWKSYQIKNNLNEFPEKYNEDNNSDNYNIIKLTNKLNNKNYIKNKIKLLKTVSLFIY